MIFDKRFMRLFSYYRAMEKDADMWGEYAKTLESKVRELEKTIRKKDEAQELSAAIIRACKSDIADLQKKVVSDSNLIESLNRYIGTLENKISYQTDLIEDLQGRLETLLAAYAHK